MWQSQNGAVAIATGYGLDDQGIGVESRWRQEFPFLHVLQTRSGAHPTSLTNGYRGFFPGSKAVEAEADYSPPCRGQENMSLYIHSPIRLHGVVLN
jgi:hypothetical protein